MDPLDIMGKLGRRCGEINDVRVVVSLRGAATVSLGCDSVAVTGSEKSQ